jgi:hypothetical protein
MARGFAPEIKRHTTTQVLRTTGYFAYAAAGPYPGLTTAQECRPKDELLNSLVLGLNSSLTLCSSFSGNAVNGLS